MVLCPPEPFDAGPGLREALGARPRRRRPGGSEAEASGQPRLAARRRLVPWGNLWEYRRFRWLTIEVLHDLMHTILL